MNNKNDAVSIAPHLHKVIFENEKVRVLEVVVNPRDTADMHTHPDNVIVVLEAGTLQMSNTAGDIKDVELKKDSAFFSSANEDAVKNIADQTVKVIQVELK